MNRTTDDVAWASLPGWRRVAVIVLLATPVLVMLAVPAYARAEPSLAGVPFFYWFQFAGVPFSMTAMCCALLLLRPSRGLDGLRRVSR